MNFPQRVLSSKEVFQSCVGVVLRDIGLSGGLELLG